MKALPAHIAWSYAVFCTVYATAIVLVFGYAVFIAHASGWWWLLALLLLACIWRPERWACLTRGEAMPEEKPRDPSPHDVISSQTFANGITITCYRSGLVVGANQHASFAGWSVVGVLDMLTERGPN